MGGTVGKDDNGNLINERITNNYNFNSILKQNGIASTSATISLNCKEAEAYPTVVKKSTLSGSAFKMSDFKDDMPYDLSLVLHVCPRTETKKSKQ